ncbi:hypothetical protein M4V62_10270 [Streptomyces durmitorensis]|uniref:Uncharacterized protein n=1 Tax=Streptomyces durmitorensis TaxID=319947 RepID=A0ABY4PPU5_9ACTN|nr:hypothetical protein [Streptomyces durmitorensis]UQT55447.1 hypothetical protein M4V62_10270 [Streptomyces durmitorensis]
MTDRTWAEEWVTVRCRMCGRRDQWPQPELGCGCGAVLRIPVRAVQAPSTDPAVQAPPNDSGAQDPPSDSAAEAQPTDPGVEAQPTDPGVEAQPTAPAAEAQPADPTPPAPPEAPTAPEVPTAPEAPAHISLPRTAPTPRPAFQPVPVRTARDAVTVAALYLRWLGYGEIRGAVKRAPSGVRVAARGMIALIEPSVQPTSLRDVECVWLSAMTESVSCVCFSLAGYEEPARARADALSIPLFVIDLTGTPQPVNNAADELMAAG